MKKSIINAISGEIEYIDMTAEEIAEYEVYKAKADAEIETWLQEQEAAAAKRSAALAKLAALGLEEDDLKALGL